MQDNVNHPPEEWNESQRKRNKEGRRQSESFCEFAKEFMGLGRAVENLKGLKTYEEVRDDVLKKLFRGGCQTVLNVARNSLSS